MELHEKLRYQRTLHKLTQKQIADFLEMTESGYGYYEQGKRKPSIESLSKLANRYGVPILYFIESRDKISLAEIKQLLLEDHLTDKGRPISDDKKARMLAAIDEEENNDEK